MIESIDQSKEFLKCFFNELEKNNIINKSEIKGIPPEDVKRIEDVYKTGLPLLFKQLLLEFGENFDDLLNIPSLIENPEDTRNDAYNLLLRDMAYTKYENVSFPGEEEDVVFRISQIAYTMITHSEPADEYSEKEKREAEILVEEYYRSDCCLLDSYIVFSSYQAEAFFFLKTEEGDPDPPVYSYREGENKFMKRADHFSDFLNMCLEANIKLKEKMR